MLWAFLPIAALMTIAPGPGTAMVVRSALRGGVHTAVFFVALFPQFVTDGAPVLPPALAMAGLIVMLDLAWYSILAVLVDRSRRALTSSPVMQRLEALMGAALLGLGVRVALEQR